MLDAVLIDLPQFNIYHSSVAPISRYYEAHKSQLLSDSDIDKLLPYAKQTEFILNTFKEILDDLSYDKEKFENIVFALDDDYDMLKKFTSKLNNKIKSHQELEKISEKILTNLIVIQNDLGLIVSGHEHRTI